MILLRTVHTRFRFGSATLSLNLASRRSSPDRSTKSTQSRLLAIPQFVNAWFQVLFHSPPGVLFTFPSQYCFSIGHQVVFRLGGWSPLLPTGFLVSRGTPDPACCFSFRIRDSHTLWSIFPYGSPKIYNAFCCPIPRQDFSSRFSLFPFRSPLLWKSRLISFPPPT